MSLISDDLSSTYKIILSIHSIGPDGLLKSKIQEFQRELKLDQKSLELLFKHLKMTANSLEEFVTDGSL